MANEKFDECLNRANTLLTSWRRAGCDYFEFLLEWKRHEEWWKGGGKNGYLTFSQVLHDTHQIMAHRLEKFERAVDECGIEQVRAVGVDGLDSLLRIPLDAMSNVSPEKPAREALADDCRKAQEKEGHPLASSSVAARARLHYTPQEEDPEPPKRYADRVAELEAINKDLRRQLAAEKRRTATLTRKLEIAEARLVQGMTPSPSTDGRRRASRMV